MSAPNTNVNKQEARHKVPLAGMKMALLWAAILLIGLVAWLSFNGNEPGNGAPIEADQGNGAATQAAE